MSWPTETLGKLIEADGGILQTGPFGSQLKQAEYSDEGIPVIMPKDISNGEINTDGVARVPQETAERLKRHQIKINGIVLPRRGEITKRAFIRSEQEGWLCGTGCIKIETNGKRIWPKFLYYYMGTKGAIGWLERNAVGSTMLNLSMGIVSRFPVACPDLETQKRIADILSAYDDLIENNRRRIALLEQAARELYKQWFVRLKFPGHEHTKITDGLPEGWERKTLGDVADLIKQTVKPSEINPNEPYIGLEHIPRRSFTLGTWRTAEGLQSNKFRFQKNDILFGRIRPYFHKVGIALVDGLTSSDAFVWRVKDKKKWGIVACATSSDLFVDVASKTVREGSRMPRADWKVLQNFQLLIPSELLQGQFIRLLMPITQQCDVLAKQNRALAKARDLLLPRLMSGRLSV